MAWFRWHEGTTSDPKFHLIARKSGQPVAFCVAVWAMLLERASAASNRGNIAEFDYESADAALGMPDGAAQAIYTAMAAKGMIQNERIAKWEERQPKREDETAASRKREQRARASQNDTLKTAQSRDDTQATIKSQAVPQCPTMSHNVPLDKIRVEEIKESSLRSDSFCAELSGDTSTRDESAPENPPPTCSPVITLPLNTGEEYPVSQEMAAKWQELYPAVDVEQQLRNMRGWLEANTSRRKTRKGILKFINRWLADKQDKGGTPRASPLPLQSAEKQSEGDIAAKKTWENYQNLRAQGVVS